MPRLKGILKSCEFETAQRQRRCSQNADHTIQAGQRCFVFNEQMRKKSYCLSCAMAILERGRGQIEQLVQQLDNPNR
jgi:hypothetical protein